MKAQIGIEFLSIFFLVLIMFVLIQAQIYTEASSLASSAATVGAQNILEESAALINLAGYSTALSAQFNLPAALPGGYAYTFSVSNASLAISWNGSLGPKTAAHELHVFNVTNATGATMFNLPAGQHFVRRTVNGVVIT